MGNQQSHPRDSSVSSSHSATSTGPQAAPRRPHHQTQRRVTYHSQRSSVQSSAGLNTSSPSDAGSYEYTLTPSTSASPSLSRVETQYHYSNRHGGSLDSHLSSQPDSRPDTAMGAASSSEKLPKQRPGNRDRNESSPRSTPVSVPSRSKSLRQRDSTSQSEQLEFRPSGPPRDHDDSTSYAPPQPVYNHPPRLPLPIEQEELTPGSPILGAKDFVDDVPPLEGEDELGIEGLRPSKSLLSQTTADDEESVGDAGDPDQLGNDTTSNAKLRTVPIEVTWPDAGEKVYVTGTFANWSKKFRMHRDPETGHAKTTLDLLPGIHHIRYIVDGDMRLREDDDQAVDYTNTLVNIIEVPAEPAFPQPSSDEEKSAGNETAGQTVASGERKASIADTTDAIDHEPQAESLDPTSQSTQKPAGPELMERCARHYGQQVPSYLLDLDRDEKTARFARASARVADIPPPPTLPGFLSKSILNGIMPMKDDSSVLNMPNHTVLNHLATSSIRQGVLATSLTTRYKRKYVTLITYRPTSLDE